MDMPRVTQADRDAAAAYMAHFRPAGWENAVAQIPLGNADLGEGVQAFARHREAAEAAPKAREAALVEALGAIVPFAEDMTESGRQAIANAHRILAALTKEPDT